MIEPFKEVIGDENKRGDLIDKIVKTRHDLTHSNLDLNAQTAKGKDLWSLCLKIDLLFQLHFLQLIGFSRSEIDSILDNYNQLTWKLQ